VEEKEIKKLEKDVNNYASMMPSVISDFKCYECLYAFIDEKVHSSHGQKITDDIVNLCEDGISNLMELEHCYKGRKRLLEKVIIGIKNNMSLNESLNNVEDVLRFTIVIYDINDYVKKTEEYLNKLGDLGYNVVCFLNFWGNEYYQGFNVLMSYRGLNLELQFHTFNGYYIKEGYTRKPYEVARNPIADKEMIDKANIIRKYYQEKVVVPEGAEGYQYQKRL